MKCSEEANPQTRKVEQLPGARMGGTLTVNMENGTQGDDETVLKQDCVDGHTTV